MALMANLVTIALAGAALWLARRTARDARATPRAGTAWALTTCLLAAAALFPETWLRGWVLSQAALLEGLWPWAGGTPPAAGGHWRNPLLGDAVWWGYPWLHLVVEAFREGRLPLWSASSYAGHPLAASFLPAVYSPFTALGVLVPLPWATVAIAMARLACGGAGMFVWLRAMGLTPPAAVLGAVACALNPFSLVWLEDPSASVVALTPWMLAALWLVVTRGSRRDLVALAVTVALVLVAGNPQTAFNVSLVAAVFAVAGVLSREGRRARVAAAARIVASVLAGVALTAVQLVPFFEYMAESRVYAARSAETVNQTFVARRTLVTAVVPGFFGHPAGAVLPVTNRFGQPTNFVEQIVYPGVALLPLAAIGLVAGRRRWPVIAVAVAGAAGAALKYGAPGALEIASQLPLLRVTPLARFGVVVILATIVLAAVGLDALLRDARPGHAKAARRRDGVTVAAATVAVLAAVVLVGASLWREHAALSASGLWPATVRQSLVAVALLLVTLTAIGAHARGRIESMTLVVVVLGITLGELLALGRGFRPLIAPDRVYPAVASIDAVRRDTGLHRVAGWGSALLPNAHVVYGLSQFRGYDSMNQRHYSALVDAALGPEVELHLDRPFVDGPIWDLLNVKYVFTRPGVELPGERFERLPLDAPVFLNRSVMPRALLVGAVVELPREEALRAVAHGRVDLRRVAVVDEAWRDVGRLEGGDVRGDRATVVDYRDELVTVRTESRERRVLVLTDLFYPGWRATIDGAPAPIHRVNVAFRGVSVPAGTHEVRFEYAPASFRVGASITGLAALVLCVTWFAPRRTSS